MEHIKFIDGLRGYAVLFVLFFHTNYTLFSGGYLGVDIFFVLSGYLILASLINTEHNNRLDILLFYKKRFFRIVPAAIFVIFLTLFVGLLILFPEELDDLFLNVKSILLLQSNVFAAKTIDYFGIQADSKPLIHYWSLSVEMQFYSLFPIFIYFIYKLRSYKYMLLIILVLFFGLFLNMVLTNLDENERYFRTSLRIWEFFAGAIAFLLKSKYQHKIELPIQIKNILILFAMIALFLSVMNFNQNSLNPGLLTFIPIVSVGLLLLYMNDNNVLAQFFLLRPITYTGKISYSLYLVHQPILAYANIILGRTFNFTESIFLLLLSYVLAANIYNFIEKPFIKNRKKMKYKLSLISLLVLTVTMSLNSNQQYLSQYNVSEDVNSILKFRYDNNPRIKECRVNNSLVNLDKVCKYGKPDIEASVALWGDSHIDQIAFPLAKALESRSLSTIELSVAGCPTIIDVNLNRSNKKQCLENTHKIYSYLLQNDEIKDIVIFYYLEYYLKNNTSVSVNGTKEENFRKQIKGLLSAGKRVHIIYPAARMLVNPPLYMARQLKINGKLTMDETFLKESEFKRQKKEVFNFLDTSLKDLKVNKIYISEYFKEGNKYIVGDGKKLFYRDDNHLSLTGGEYISEHLAEKIVEYKVD